MSLNIISIAKIAHFQANSANQFLNELCEIFRILNIAFVDILFLYMRQFYFILPFALDFTNTYVSAIYMRMQY